MDGYKYCPYTGHVSFAYEPDDVAFCLFFLPATVLKISSFLANRISRTQFAIPANVSILDSSSNIGSAGATALSRLPTRDLIEALTNTAGNSSSTGQAQDTTTSGGNAQLLNELLKQYKESSSSSS